MQKLASPPPRKQYGNRIDRSAPIIDRSAPIQPQLLEKSRPVLSRNALTNLSLGLAVLSFLVFKVSTVDIELSRGWTTAEILYRMLPDNWAAYEAALDNNPILVKGILTGVTYLLGDWLAQVNENNKANERDGSTSNIWLDVDRSRLLRPALAGLFLLGPLAHFYYDFNEAQLAFLSWPLKIVVDQTFYLLTYNTIYFCSLGLLEGEKPQDVFRNYKDQWWPFLSTGWKLWPLVGIVTYTIIPLRQRVLWVDAIEIVYSVILSTMYNNDALEDASDASEQQR